MGNWRGGGARCGALGVSSLLALLGSLAMPRGGQADVAMAIDELRLQCQKQPAGWNTASCGYAATPVMPSISMMLNCRVERIGSYLTYDRI